jgi:two-component system LytT family response regulator
MITAYLVDDEKPALDRLSRMLQATRRVELVGVAADPVQALEELPVTRPDVLFLDIRMPELSGFELLENLDTPPLVVFTTAYDEYALKAFEENSVDYLVKPIDAEALDRALGKTERLLHGTRNLDVAEALNRIVTSLDASSGAGRLKHLTSRVGQRFKVIDIDDVTHIFAQDKVTHAVTLEKRYVIDEPIAQLESRLDPAGFIRIHRGVILNLAYLEEVHACTGGRAIVRLKDPKRTELVVARSRVRVLKERLGMRKSAL